MMSRRPLSANMAIGAALQREAEQLYFGELTRLRFDLY